MILSSININTNRSVSDKIRLCFWCYLLMLIFEGAIRKWFLPGLSDLFLVIRDPIVLYVIYLSVKYRLLKDKFIIYLFVLSIISFVLTLLFGHHNIGVALYGVRITLLHIPSIFIFGKILSRQDIYLIGKVVLCISVVMFVIILLQYFSSSNSWINRGTGGVGTASFQAISGYMRPSGTFSFTSGLCEFELLVNLYLFYFLYNNNSLGKTYRLNFIILLVFTVIFFFSIVLCLSRAVIFQTFLMSLIILVYPFFMRENIIRAVNFVLLFIVLCIILLQFDVFKLALENIFIRFEQASKSEGHVIEGTLGERLFGSFYRAFFDTQNFSNKDIPFFGFGLGIGTKVGEAILNIRSIGHSFAFAEEEWSRIICEVGLFQGIFYLLVVRLFFPIYFLIKALTYIRKDFFLYLSIFPFLLYMINSQWTVPTSLGFTVVLSSLFMASYYNNINNQSSVLLCK